MKLPAHETDSDSKARHLAYIEQRNNTITAARAARGRTLENDAPRIRKALEAYRLVDRLQDPTDIRLRCEFVVSDRAPLSPDLEIPYAGRRASEVRARPPLARLINRKSNALSFYLTAVYLAHLEHSPGTAVPPTRHNTYEHAGPAWATLAGMHDGARPELRRRRIHRALTVLHDHELIGAGPPRKGKYAQWTLQREDGTGRPYKVPGESGPAAATIRIPDWFFWQGWHLVLLPREIAVFFMIVHHTQCLPFHSGIGIPPSVRRTTYHIADDTYSDSIHELHDFGLIQVYDPMPHRTHGKVAGHTSNDDEPLPTYHIHYPSPRPRDKDLAERSALEVVLADLEHPLPGRLYEDRKDPRDHPRRRRRSTDAQNS